MPRKQKDPPAITDAERERIKRIMAKPVRKGTSQYDSYKGSGQTLGVYRSFTALND